MEAVRRECREEIDVEVSGERSVDVDVDVIDPDLVPHVFLVTTWIGQPVNAAPDEHDTPAGLIIIRRVGNAGH